MAMTAPLVTFRVDGPPPLARRVRAARRGKGIHIHQTDETIADERRVAAAEVQLGISFDDLKDLTTGQVTVAIMPLAPNPAGEAQAGVVVLVEATPLPLFSSNWPLISPLVFSSSALMNFAAKILAMALSLVELA